MELKLQKADHEYYETLRFAPFPCETMRENIVPDSCGDIARVVDTTGCVCLTGRELTGDGRFCASGNVEGTPGVLLQGPRGVLSLPQGVIIADRHLHMSTAQAAAFGLKDGDTVRIQVGGGKPGILDGVLVRAGDQYELDLHLDTDDANAFQLKQGQLVTVLE